MSINRVVAAGVLRLFRAIKGGLPLDDFEGRFYSNN